ncbi:hypothetical protein [Lysinibacillus xylanilyticus]|uniref:hypothetical protein n=1 Tax=Lysinibacillus xylanilyticus TaxID=582475 RepID=UPI003D08B6DE
MTTNDTVQLRIDFLNTRISDLTSNMYFQFTLFWALLSVLAALLGLTAYIVIKKFTESRVKKEISEFKKELRNFDLQWFSSVLLMGFSGNLEFTKDYFEVVHLRGLINKSSTNQVIEFSKMPVGYRPTRDMIFTIPLTNSDSLEYGLLIIEESGNVILKSRSKGNFSLDGVYYHTK